MWNKTGSLWNKTTWDQNQIWIKLQWFHTQTSNWKGRLRCGDRFVSASWQLQFLLSHTDDLLVDAYNIEILLSHTDESSICVPLISHTNNYYRILVGTKPLCDPILVYHELDHLGANTNQIWIKLHYFSYTNWLIRITNCYPCDIVAVFIHTDELVSTVKSLI